MDSTTLEIYKQHVTSISKYTYFLLAVAASAIAFAIQKTDNRILEWSLLPLAFSVFCWGISFYFGARHLIWAHAALRANIIRNTTLLRMDKNNPNLTGYKNKMNEIIEENSDKSGKFSRWQFYYLIGGMILFVIWHTFEMYLRTYSI